MFIGLGVAVAYLVLHELGHVLFALLLGVKIEGITLFSEFNIICQFDDSQITEIVLTGYGGIIVPIILSVFFVPDIFIFRYMNFVVKILNLLVVINAFCALVLSVCNMPVYQNDITTVLEISEKSLLPTMVVLILCLIVVVLSLFRCNITKEIYCFYVNDKKLFCSMSSK